MNNDHVAGVLEQSGLFDAEWYAAEYKDVEILGMCPVEHYIRIGARLMRDPGPNFDTKFYLRTHPDVADAGVNPLWHFVAHGKVEGRQGLPTPAALLENEVPRWPVPLLSAPPLQQRPARVICFYLPQFHPIAENDEWWGEGFTEWSNVKPAKPQFEGHYQPHVPGDLGYYDLRDVDAQRAQIELAKTYGIEGFCFYFYWFGGKRLLESPVRKYLDDPSLDLPFCLCWANENWSRRWDGLDSEILIAQDHSPDDDVAFIKHVAQYMRDARYIRIDGKPLLLVYRPSLLPGPAQTVARWRAWCRDNGLGEIYLAYTQSFESGDPSQYGFDAAIEFPPNNSGMPLVTESCPTNEDFTGRIYDWSVLAERSASYATPDYKLFRGLCPSWDNTARRKVNGTILVNTSPSKFTRWTSNAIYDTKTRYSTPSERLVFINAWNEWAEGAHLEPDRLYGHAWLESVRVALARNADIGQLSVEDARIALVVEGCRPEGLRLLLDLVQKWPDRHMLFVTTTPPNAAAIEKKLKSSGRAYSLRLSQGPNDRMPLLGIYSELRSAGFEVVVGVDAQRLVPGGRSGSRADDLIRETLATFSIERSLAAFAADTSLGMLLPDDLEEHITSASAYNAALLDVGARLGFSRAEVLSQRLMMQDVFVARTAALEPLTSLAFADQAFQPGNDRSDHSLAQSIVHALTLSVVACGMEVASMKNVRSCAASDDSMPSRQRMIVVSHDAHPHGAQLLAMNMARSFGALGFDIDMIVLGEGPLLERFAQVATVHRVDLANKPGHEVLAMLRELRAAGVQFAIANTTVSGLLVPLLRRADIPTVSLIHELPGILNDYKLQEHARAIATHANSVVFPADIVRRGFEEFIGETLPQGLIRPQGLYMRSPYRLSSDRNLVRKQVRHSLGLEPNARIILCVGYADHRKGLDLFIDSCIGVMAVDAMAFAVWVGHLDQALFNELRPRITDSGMEDRFVFTGLVDKPQPFYTAADVYALTSREDPFPSVVMEALDASVPVVLFSGVGGSDELIGRDCGVLVSAFDTEAMTAALARLLNDPVEAARLAGNGRAIIEQEFSFPHYLHDLAALAENPLPRVSVVVPNYNYARYIVERLESIRQQTAPIYELIVLDDASTDSSAEIIEDYLAACDIPSRFVVNADNSGSVFKQWQRGVEMARGDFVWIAEADDLADVPFLEKVLPAFADPSVVMSYVQSRQMGSDGEILCEHYLDYVSDIDCNRWTKPYVAAGTEEIATAMFVKNTIPNVSAVVFRRDALREVLRDHSDEICSYRNAGDWVAYLRVLERGAIAFSPTALNSHRRHQSSVTVGNFNESLLKEIIRVQEDAINRLSLGTRERGAADTYAQKLYVQFGLSSSTYPEIHSNPEFFKPPAGSGVVRSQQHKQK